MERKQSHGLNVEFDLTFLLSLESLRPLRSNSLNFDTQTKNNNFPHYLSDSQILEGSFCDVSSLFPYTPKAFTRTFFFL